MAYIIENANILKKKKLETTSLLVKDKRISSIRSTLKRYSYVRMNASPYVMTPPYTVFDPHIPFDKSFSEMKEYYISQFIKKGCTSFLTYTEVEQEYLLRDKLKSLKAHLLNSPIDFVIGVKIPIRLLTPDFIRKTKREKVPILFVEVEHSDELFDIPWGWIREAMFPYNAPISPVFKGDKPRDINKSKSIWKEIMEKEKIPSTKDEIREREPISFQNLCKIGILPLKSIIHQGGEVSYNFYEQSQEISNIEDSELFLYHNDKLLITVHKDTVIRAGDHVLYRPGFGEHVIINTPSFFVYEE
ncbi:hypothetical protein ACFYKX_16640 [Cytobacillus sp. FJAT-54145]|uniref:Uncharacterized protein n=1 Tax=Cytobacillus spartinae TaxID=3299023 RepID=A0ABW6KH90_9BACI